MTHISGAARTHTFLDLLSFCPTQNKKLRVQRVGALFFIIPRNAKSMTEIRGIAIEPGFLGIFRPDDE